LDGKAGVVKLHNLSAGPTGIDKTSYVRVLQIYAGLVWTKGDLGILDRCLLNVRRLSFTAHGSKVLGNVWEVVKDAPKLEHLELFLFGDVFDSFNCHTVFPASVRVLHLHIKGPKHAKAFICMLDSRAPNLLEIRIDGGHIEAEQLSAYDLKSYPTFASKISGVSSDGRSLHLVPKTIQSLNIYTNGRAPNVISDLEQFRSLASLTVCGFETEKLPQFAQLFPKLEKLLLHRPRLNLDPAEYVRAVAAIFRPGMEARFEFSCHYERNEKMERDFWVSHPGATCRFF
jgi:hypothetical protein